MIFLVYLLVFIISLLLNLSTFKKALNYGCIFTICWCTFGYFSSLGLFSLRIPSFTVHIFSWIFVLLFNFSTWIFSHFHLKVAKTNGIYNIRSKYIAVNSTEIIAVFLSLPTLLIMCRYILVSGFESLRSFYYSGEVYDNQYLDLIFRSMPVGILSALVIVYVFLFSKNFKLPYLLISIFNSLLITLLNGGGRYAILSLIFSLLIIFFILPYKKRSLSKSIIKKIICLCASFIIILVFITFIRGQSLFKGIIKYYSGSFSFLDYILEHGSIFGLKEKTFGYLTFSGAIEPIILICKVFGITKIKTPGYIFNSCCQKFYNIGSYGAYIPFNNNTTIIYYFLKDFGVSGIFILTPLFSFSLYRSFLRARSGNSIYILLFTSLCICLFNSVMTYQFFGMTPLYCLLSFLMVKVDEKI